MDVVVAGAGIGGLAAALAAALAGHRVTVLEQRPEFAELGAGIQLGPNAFRALDSLGVGDAVRDRAVHIEALRLLDGPTGRRLAQLPLGGDYRRRFGNPYAVVARADLHLPLLQACRSAAVSLHPGRRVVGYRQDGSGVTVLTDPHETLRTDLLIGADGLRSATRAALVGDGPPHVSGHTIYRTVVPMEAVPEELRSNTVTLWAGPGWHFVHYPIASGQLFNLAATRDDRATTEVTGAPADPGWVRRQFPGMGDAARRLQALGVDWRSWVRCDRDPQSRWVDRRVGLLGDAAHPMLQYAAQGACMALEDAVVLGQQLRRRDLTAGQALVRYQALRIPRATRAQTVARAVGERVYHPVGAAARRRDALLADLGEHGLQDAVAWLHGARRFDEAV